MELPSAHPLDLLINAISGSNTSAASYNGGGEGEVSAGQHPHESSEDVELSFAGLLTPDIRRDFKRKRGVSLSPRQIQISNTVVSHLVSEIQGAGPSTLSTIQVWHPSTAQKSYGKEKRMLNPPPMLYVAGPLLPFLTTATLAATSTTAETFSAQTRLIPLSGEASAEELAIAALGPAGGSADSTSRKRLRETKVREFREAAMKSGFGATLPKERQKLASWEREALRDGLAFPGLYVPQEVGKAKEFKLQLTLGQPGISHTLAIPPPQSLPQSQIPEAPLPDVIEGLDSDESNHLHSILQVADPINIMQLDDPATPSGMDAIAGQIDPTLDNSISAELQGSAEHLGGEASSSVTAAPWATLPSTHLTIISKPSVKTAKARSLASCLMPEDSFSLFVRINSQTVRTKYLKVETGGERPRLTSRTGTWTPFRFEVVRRASTVGGDIRAPRGRFKSNSDFADRVMTYGSIGHLVDLQSGVRSELVRLVKVEKNENVIGSDIGHPVSDLQRVGFVRLVRFKDDLTEGGRWYLSAPGARIGGGELNPPELESLASAPGPANVTDSFSLDATTTAALDGHVGDLADASTPAAETLAAAGQSEGTVETPGPVKKSNKRKTRRNALAQAVMAESEETSALSWAKAQREERSMENGQGMQPTLLETVEKVEDWMCWILSGVSSFKYSFLDGLQVPGSLPAQLDPVSHTLAEPAFNPESNTLQLTLNDFFFPDENGIPVPLQVFLGPMGPLSYTTWTSIAAPRSTLDDVAHPLLAVPYNADDPNNADKKVLSAFPSQTPHVIVLVELPSPEAIIQTMQECVSEAQFHPGNVEDQPEVEFDPGLEQSVVEQVHPQEQNQDQEWFGGVDEGMPTHAAGQEGVDEAIRQALGVAAAQGGQQGTSVDDIDIEAALQAHTASGFDFEHDLRDFIDPDLAATLNQDVSTLDQVQVQVQVQGQGQVQGNGNGDLRQGSHSQPDLLADPANVGEEGQRPDLTQTTPANIPIELTLPPANNAKSPMTPLPFLLVRKSDGTVFGVNRSVVAEKLKGKGKQGSLQWGLRVVPS